jgi:hypothetical protein
MRRADEEFLGIIAVVLIAVVMVLLEAEVK